MKSHDHMHEGANLFLALVADFCQRDSVTKEGNFKDGRTVLV